MFKRIVFCTVSFLWIILPATNYAQNEIDLYKLRQRNITYSEYILLQLNVGLLYATQEITGVKSARAEYDNSTNKFVLNIVIKKELYHFQNNSGKKKFIKSIVNNIVVNYPDFFYAPVSQILKYPAKNYGDILSNYLFKFEKWYEADGYEPLTFPEKKESESKEAHIKRIDKWQKDSGTFSLLATYENGEVTLFK